MDYNQLAHLQNLLNVEPEKEEDQMPQKKGSVLNPGTVGGGKDTKEVAKPYAKIETTVNERNPLGGGAKPNKPSSDIWQADEVKDIFVDKHENRETPEFDVMFRQKVGSEDVYLGMSDLDPSSSKCQELLMKIQLPKTNFKDVSLDVTEQVVCVQTSKYFLYHVLPYKVNEKEGKAQWISDKSILQITLPIIRDDFF